MINGYSLGQGMKKRVLGGYVRLLDRIDPQVAKHLLGAQRELFMAGKTFFEEELRHADRAMAKLDAKLQDKPATPPPAETTKDEA